MPPALPPSSFFLLLSFEESSSFLFTCCKALTNASKSCYYGKNEISTNQSIKQTQKSRHILPLLAATTHDSGRPNCCTNGPNCPDCNAWLNEFNAC